LNGDFIFQTKMSIYSTKIRACVHQGERLQLHGLSMGFCFRIQCSCFVAVAVAVVVAMVADF
jgi:hypothetical protein